MKRIRIMGLALIAVLAMASIAAASASAEPQGEFGRCVAQAGGKYATSACTTEVAGKTKFEWLPLVKRGISSKLKEGIPTLETVGGTKITCKGESSGGAFKANNKEVEGVEAHFTGCETSGLKCSSAGKPEGEIVTSALEGRLGVEKVGTKPPVNNKLALELHAPAGSNVAEFSCAGLAVVVKGSVLHPATTGKMVLTATEKFTASKGEQKPEKFAGGTTDEHILESNTSGGKFEEAGQTITALATFEEKVEANPTKG
jgi:opacity protein-like surface antigen